jgi:hypothetical protein
MILFIYFNKYCTILICRKLRKNSTILLFFSHVKKAWTKNAKSKINKIEDLAATLKDIGDKMCDIGIFPWLLIKWPNQ